MGSEMCIRDRVEPAELNEALQALEAEGTVQLAGDRERRTVRLL